AEEPRCPRLNHLRRRDRARTIDDGHVRQRSAAVATRRESETSSRSRATLGVFRSVFLSATKVALTRQFESRGESGMCPGRSEGLIANESAGQEGAVR